MRRILCGIALMGTMVVLVPGIASARPNYLGAFTKLYSPKAGGALAGAKCGICHVNGQPKSVRNPYGQALGKALGKEKASDDEATASLKKIEGEKAPGSKETFGDLIKADKLPGGK